MRLLLALTVAAVVGAAAMPWPAGDGAPAIGAVEAHPAVRDRPILPAVPPKDCVLPMTYGDNATEATAALQALLDSCTSVTFSSGGRFLTRPVSFSHSNTTLFFDPNATVVAWGDIDTYNTTSSATPALFSYDHASSVIQNVSVVGRGDPASGDTAPTVDGQGWRWWGFGKTRSRPHLLTLQVVQNLHITNMRWKDSPSFHLLLRGDSITVRDSRVEANIESCGGYHAAPNTDAYNIGGTNIFLQHLFAHNGDDCMPTNPLSFYDKSGGLTSNVVAEDVHCECGTNSGVPIIGGGGPNERIDGVIYRNITALGLNQGAGMKISEAYENVTGTATNVTWQDVTVVNPRNTGIYTNVFEEDAAPDACRPPANASARVHWLSASNFTFERVSVTGAPYAACFNCGPTRPCTGFTFTDVHIEAKGGFVCHSFLESHATNSTPPPCA